MYELIQAGERTWYFEAPSKVGAYVEPDGSVILIDSGNDKDAGRRILKQIAEQGWSLRAILNTHSNADHIGANAFLQQRTGCKIYAYGVEAAFTQYPLLEPAFLYGGFAPKALRNKLLLAQPSQVIQMEGNLPAGFELLPLPGHYFDMVGLRTPGDVIFLADALFSETILNKYHVSFLYNVKMQLQTLEMLKTVRAALFIPSHAQATKDILPLIDCNKAKILEFAALLIKLAKFRQTEAELLSAVFEHYELKMDFNQYVLIGSTLRSYLSYLVDEGALEAKFEQNMLWYTAL